MLEMLMQWYRRRFSDPEAIALLVILVAGFGILFFFSGLLAPLLVAIVLAYLLGGPPRVWNISAVPAAGRPALSGAVCRYSAADVLRGDAHRPATGDLPDP